MKLFIVLSLLFTLSAHAQNEIGFNTPKNPRESCGSILDIRTEGDTTLVRLHKTESFVKSVSVQGGASAALLVASKLNDLRVCVTPSLSGHHQGYVRLESN